MADVAQLVEQSIRNRQVIGSSPIVGSSPFIRAYPLEIVNSASGLNPRSGRGDHVPGPLLQAHDRAHWKNEARAVLERSD